MRWRTHQRGKILEKCRGQIRSCQMGQELAFDARAYQNRSETFIFGPTTSSLGVLLGAPDRYETRVNLFDPPVGVASVQFNAQPAPLMVFDHEATVVRTIPIDNFPCLVHRFTFQRRKEESPRTLFGSGPMKGARICLPRVPAPPRPPAPKTTDLEERLHWILTPPIHELLSDPQLCLPEKPYPFQTFGIKWLYDRSNALLADEMGLGKSMQAIIAARLLWRDSLIDHVLIICPKTLISTWQSEIRKWWPNAADHVALCGSDRLYFLRLATRSIVIKIINYESLAREDHTLLRDEAFEHDLIIIDEAQKIKNESKTHSAVTALPASRRWALTGTPLENKPSDVVHIFGFVHPGLLSSDDGPYVARTIRPYILRRRAEQVLPELPEKSEQDIPVELDDAHRRIYEQAENDGVVELNSKGDAITVTHVFQLITKLRQICNFDPASGRSAKLDLLLQELEEVRDSDRKALVFSQFVHEEYGLKKLAKEVSAHGFKALELHGEVPQRRREGIKKDFCTDPSITVMLLNFMVGGLGLNLQAANYVFLFDRWWNPAVEDQAVKRVHRIGQTRKVFIRRFFCKGTIEERILKKLAEKRRLFRNIIDEACPEPDSMGLSEEEIFSLFNLSVRPKKHAGATPPRARVDLKNMDPYQFEELVARIYEAQGYTVKLTGGSHDGGIDIFAERSAAGAVERVIVQCKHQQAKVGRPTLQQLWGVVNADQSYTRGDLATNSEFSSEAIDFAQGKRLSLIDGKLLMELALQFDIADFAVRKGKGSARKR